MINRKLMLLIFGGLLLTVGTASAADCWWGVVEGNWNVPANWWGNEVPTIEDDASINDPVPTVCIIDANVVCKALYVGHWSQDEPEEGAPAAWGVLSIIDGGSLVVAEEVDIGQMATTYNDLTQAMGDIDVNTVGGTVEVGADFSIGREGLGKLNMRAGTLNIAGTLWCPGGPLPWYAAQNYQVGTAEGHLNLHGGTIIAGDIDVYANDICQMDIMDGTLIIDGDQVSKIEGWVGENKLFGHGGLGNLEIDYNVRNTGKTTVTSSYDPNCASTPDPMNYAQNVPVNAQLSWVAGVSAVEHDVYFGTDFDDVNNAADPLTLPGRGTKLLGDESYDPGSLVSGADYYWRIDEDDGLTTHKGYVWRFTAERSELARNPVPENNAKSVPPNVVLSWLPGIYALSHDVYVGTSFDAVNNATTSSPEWKANQEPNSYDPNVAFEQTVFWRIDEVDASETYKGDVWNFTTDDRLLIDNFEPPLTWSVAAGYASFGVSSDSPPVQGGMAGLFEYDNRFGPDYYSELECVLPPELQDFTVAGAEILALSYHGKPDNYPERMYIVLEDVSNDTVEIVEPNGLVQELREYWKWWAIDLNPLAGSVDLTQIQKLIIGFGDRNSPTASDPGGVYIDNIELLPRTSYNRDDDGDYNNDGIVDVNDFVIIARSWRETGYSVSAATASSTGLVIWYEFEDSGTTATDSSSPQYNGTLNLGSWTSGYSGGGLLLDAEEGIYVDISIAAAPSSLAGHSTVAFWLKEDGQSDEAGPFQIGDSFNGGIQVYAGYTGVFEYTCGWDSVHEYADSVAWGTFGYTNHEYKLGQWNHLAFVKDATEGTIRIYCNGQLMAEWDNAKGTTMKEDLVQDEDFFTIGCWRWVEETETKKNGFYNGVMDDFRLYNRALSHEEILDLADVSSLEQPVVSFAEVVIDNEVNFADVVPMADAWLGEPLWP